jgi:hypothetical protein
VGLSTIGPICWGFVVHVAQSLPPFIAKTTNFTVFSITIFRNVKSSTTLSFPCINLLGIQFKYYIKIIPSNNYSSYHKFTRIKQSLSINFSTPSVRQILIKVYQYSYNKTAHSRKYLGLDYT